MAKNDKTPEVIDVETTDMQVAETQAISTNVTPARGFERMDMDSLSFPTARLLQPTSPEITEDGYEDYNLRPGMVIHSYFIVKLAENFVPLMVFDDKILLSPREEARIPHLKTRVHELHNVELTQEDLDNNIICRSFDNKQGDRFGACNKCKLAEFNGSEKPYCNKNVNVLALFEGQELPVVIRFTATSYKHGKTFKNLAFYSGVDLFTRRYKLCVTKKQQDNNTWFELSVKPAGLPSDDMLKKAEALYKRFRDAIVTVDDASINKEADTVADVEVAREY